MMAATRIKETSMEYDANSYHVPSMVEVREVNTPKDINPGPKIRRSVWNRKRMKNDAIEVT